MKIGLSIDGGGIRGLVAALIGEALEKASGDRLQESVDLFYGTSTGGILALGAARHFRMSTMKNLYLEQGAAIFGKRQSFGWKGLHKAEYARDPLRHILTDLFDDARLCDLEPHTAVTTYSLDTTDPLFLKSWVPQHRDMRVVDAGCATGAAWPNYFEYQSVPHAGDLIDGGYVGNNPCAFCCVDLTDLYPDETDDMVIISIGTGEAIRPFATPGAKRSGLLHQRSRVIDVLFDASSNAMSYIVRKLTNARLIRFQPRLVTASPAMDDASRGNLNRLREDTERFLDENSPQIEEAAKILKSAQR